ncbi:MAG TPA: threonine--tRNA ligase [Chloroflexota bacterium]|nr:threonine--tRNA ligase [Chloroflexota bacterium]
MASPVYEGDVQSSGVSELDAMRHSLAHIMAEAVLQIFPDARLGIGPWIENGFYYDFDLPRPLTPDDLAKIEELMRQRIASGVPFERHPIMHEAAEKLFADQPYKLELIEGFAGQDLSVYHHGNFTDLCRGPHVADTSKVGAFKLMSVAGAYWRGDEHRPMLQRIYGVAFPTQQELDDYLERLEQARQRDHRKLGKELGLFTFSDMIGPGIPLFYPKGEMLRHLMESYVRETQIRYGYQHVWTAHLAKKELFVKSGHWEHYHDVMFPPMVDEDQVFLLKPMNCPSHMTLFNTQLHSYRELPLRYAEFATLYRYEKSGQLNGLTRVRALTQDDCHIFCTPGQVEEEFGRALDLIREVLDTYGFTDYHVQLSLPDLSDTAKYVDDREKWALAEEALRNSLDAKGVQYTPMSGEAAFYGPKADFMAKDVLGREWQLSTIQVDLIQPARLGVEYIGEDNTAHTPVVLHRAVTGTTERFMGVIIEHFAGAFPVWLSPVQAVVLSIADRHVPYAQEVAARMNAAGLRVEADTRNERLQYKIREAQLQKTPYMLVVGDNEAAAGTVSVRLRSGEKRDAVPVEALIEEIAELTRTRAR